MQPGRQAPPPAGKVADKLTGRAGSPIWPSIPLSVLDLAPVIEGGDAGQALRHA
jgi:hypothetical protein